MLINWTDKQWLITSLSDVQDNGLGWLSVITIPSIPYPTVEALLCWWIVGMLFFIALMLHAAIKRPHSARWMQRDGFIRVVCYMIFAGFVVVPVAVYSTLRK